MNFKFKNRKLYKCYIFMLLNHIKKSIGDFIFFFRSKSFLMMMVVLVINDRGYYSTKKNRNDSNILCMAGTRCLGFIKTIIFMKSNLLTRHIKFCTTSQFCFTINNQYFIHFFLCIIVYCKYIICT